MFTKLFPIVPHLYSISFTQSFIVTFKLKGEIFCGVCQKFDHVYLIMGHSLKDTNHKNE
jgi:hypothetical protein